MSDLRRSGVMRALGWRRLYWLPLIAALGVVTLGVLFVAAARDDGPPGRDADAVESGAQGAAAERQGRPAIGSAPDAEERPSASGSSAEPSATAPLDEEPVRRASAPAEQADAAPAGAGSVPPAVQGNDWITRLRIPSVGVEAPVVTGYVDRNSNMMIAPDSPTAVAWYEYTPLPAAGGNAVFAGHVDYVNYGPAVFRDLNALVPGDRIHLDLAGGETLTYEVQFNDVYSAADGPWEQLFHPYADSDVLTLYTCDGVFANGQYTERRVVRATRAP